MRPPDQAARLRPPRVGHLPDRIRRLLSAVTRRAAMGQFLATLPCVICTVGGGWIGAFVVDRLWAPPWWLRLGFLSVVAWAVVVVVFRCVRRIRGVLSPANAARLVNHWNETLGDMLLGAVELTSHESHDPAAQPLVRAALAQAEERCGDITAARIVRIRASRGMWSASALVLVLMGIGILGLPEVFFNSARRLFRPWEDTPRLTLARLHAVPSVLVVPVSETSTLNCELRADSLLRPKSLRWRLGDVHGMVYGDDDGGYNLALPPVTAAVSLRLRCGDARHTVRLTPRSRPTLTDLVFIVTYKHDAEPRRLSLDTRLQSLSSSVSTGSEVILEGVSDQPLADIDVSAPPGVRTELGPDRKQFRVAIGTVAGDMTLCLLPVAVSGLAGPGAVCVALTVVPDRGPNVVWNGGRLPTGMPRAGILPVRFLATDDHGVRQIRLLVNRPDGSIDQTVLSRTLPPGVRSASLETSICPLDLGFDRGDTMRLEVQAMDGTSGAKSSGSAVVTIRISAAHETVAGVAATVRRLWRELADIHRRETKQNEAEQAILDSRTRDPHGITVARTGQHVARRDAALLQALAVQLEDLIARAATVGELDSSDGMAWLAAARVLRSLALTELPEVARVLSVQGQATADMWGAAIALAVPMRKAILASLQAVLATEAQFRRGDIRTAALRLQAAARQEQAIVSALEKLPDDWNGVAVGDLSEIARATLRSIAARQHNAAREIECVADLLGRLVARGGAPGQYTVVVEAIERSALVADLDIASEQVRRNHRFFALSAAAKAALQLTRWATVLEAASERIPEDGGGGIGGTPGGDGSMALRLLRILALQEAIRIRTACVIEVRENPGWGSRAGRSLALEQRRLAEGMPDLIDLCPDPIASLLTQAATAMDEAASQLEANRIGLAQAHQDEAVEWLQSGMQRHQTSDSGVSGSAAGQVVHAVRMGRTGTTLNGEQALPANPQDRTPTTPAAVSGRPHEMTGVTSWSDGVPMTSRQALRRYRRLLENLLHE